MHSYCCVFSRFLDLLDSTGLSASPWSRDIPTWIPFFLPKETPLVSQGCCRSVPNNSCCNHKDWSQDPYSHHVHTEHPFNSILSVITLLQPLYCPRCHCFPPCQVLGSFLASFTTVLLIRYINLEFCKAGLSQGLFLKALYKYERIELTWKKGGEQQQPWVFCLFLFSWVATGAVSSHNQ